MRGHGTALAHLLFLAARRRLHEFGLHGCLLRSHPLTLPTAPISFNFLAVNDIATSPGLVRESAAGGAPGSVCDRGGWHWQEHSSGGLCRADRAPAWLLDWARAGY